MKVAASEYVSLNTMASHAEPVRGPHGKIVRLLLSSPTWSLSPIIDEALMATVPPVEQYEPTQEARDLHAKHIAQAWADQQASTDAFDNNLLTFSSAALGLSIAFIKDIVPLENAEWLKTLYFSWAAFAGCILVTIASFQIAAQAQFAHQKTLSDYYLMGDKSAINRKSGWTEALPYCAGLGSLLLLIGIISTLVFASKNVTHYKESKAWHTTAKPKK